MSTSNKKVYDYPWRKKLFKGEDYNLDIPDGDATRGEALFKRNCGGCHKLEQNDWLGPALGDVFNRKIGSKKGFYYTNSMFLTKGHWTRERLFVFLENPENVVPQTAMFFDGIKDSYDRACIIEYLQSIAPVKSKERLPRSTGEEDKGNVENVENVESHVEENVNVEQETNEKE